MAMRVEEKSLLADLEDLLRASLEDFEEFDESDFFKSVHYEQTVLMVLFRYFSTYHFGRDVLVELLREVKSHPNISESVERIYRESATVQETASALPPLTRSLLSHHSPSTKKTAPNIHLTCSLLLGAFSGWRCINELDNSRAAEAVRQFGESKYYFGEFMGGVHATNGDRSIRALSLSGASAARNEVFRYEGCCIEVVCSQPRIL